MFRCVRQLFRENYDRKRRVRLLGVGMSKLMAGQQQRMLPFIVEGRPEVSNAVDTIRDRLGYDAIHFGMKGTSRWKT